MFELELYDNKGNKLQIGDWVAISGSNNNNTCFYTQIKYLENEQTIIPFHTFSFHKIKKIEKLPEDAVKSYLDEGYDIWYSPKYFDTEDMANKYLLSWVECERRIDERCYRIKPIHSTLFQ